MEILLLLAVVIGLLQARLSILSIRNGIDPGVPASNSLIDFVFFNK